MSQPLHYFSLREFGKRSTWTVNSGCLFKLRPVVSQGSEAAFWGGDRGSLVLNRIFEWILNASKYLSWLLRDSILLQGAFFKLCLGAQACISGLVVENRFGRRPRMSSASNINHDIVSQNIFMSHILILYGTWWPLTRLWRGACLEKGVGRRKYRQDFVQLTGCDIWLASCHFFVCLSLYRSHGREYLPGEKVVFCCQFQIAFRSSLSAREKGRVAYH